MKKQLSFFLVFSCAVLTVSAQQRIGDASTGSKLPNKDAILELESKNKALLVSRIALSSTTVATPLSVHTAGMIAYNTATINDVVPGIYYNDGTKWLLVGKGETTNIKYDPVTNIISYIDGSGNAVTIDIAGIVRGSQTVTKVVAEVLDGKNTGKYTYYNEKDIDKDGNITGPGTVINVVGDVQNNFQEIVNNTAVKQIFETIVKNTGGNVSYNATTNSFTYVDGTGTTQTINITDMVKNNETLTTLAYDNATKVLTYKDEAGTTNTINIGSLVKNNETLTTLAYDNATKVLTYKDEKGLNTSIDISTLVSGNETLTVLSYDNATNTLTYKDEAGTTNTINLTNLVQNNQKNTSVSSGTYTTVAATTPTTNNTDYKVDVNPSTLAGPGLKVNAGKLEVDIATIPNASDKTATVANGTNTTVTTDATNPNNPIYKVNVATASGTTLGVVKEAATTPTVNIASDGTLSVNTTQLQANQKTSSVVSGTTTTVSSATTGNNTAYTVEINPSSVQNSQKLTTLSNGNNTTVASTTSGNTTDYKVNVNNATAAATGAVKPGSGLTVAADGTLSVNTTASGLGKNLTPADGSIFIGTGTGATLVDANVSVATGGITDTKIAADAVTTTKIANSAVTAAKLSAGAGAAGRVGITDASGAITYGTLPAGSVTGNNFTSTDLTITNGTGATLTAVSAVIAPNAVTTAKIANGTILDADIAAAAAIAVTKLANGADGQVLTTNGSVPTWTNPSALAVNNLYTSNGSLTANRTVDLNAKTLTFKDNIAANAGASTELSYASGNASMLHSAAATKRSEIILTTNGSQLNVFQDPGAPSQIITSGTSTSLNIGTGTSNPMTLATNSAPRMIVAANGNIGMGTGTALTTPSNVLHVNATNPLRLEGLQGQAAVASNQLIVADNTGVLKTIAAAGNNQMLTTNGSGVPTWTNQSTIASSLEPWRVQGTTNGATSNADNIYQTGNVAIGATTAPAGADASAKLYVNGTITTANSLYADYVFEDYFEGASRLNNDYTFKSLKEIEEFIYKNKHLPGVTGIKGLAKNDKGEYVFNISKLSVQLLEKVEELYLHTIEQQKKLDIKDKEIQDLKAQQQKTEERLKRLEEAVLGKANK